jgi:hypothetical protein
VMTLAGALADRLACWHDKARYSGTAGVLGAPGSAGRAKPTRQAK